MPVQRISFPQSKIDGARALCQWQDLGFGRSTPATRRSRIDNIPGWNLLIRVVPHKVISPRESLAIVPPMSGAKTDICVDPSIAPSLRWGGNSVCRETVLVSSCKAGRPLSMGEQATQGLVAKWFACCYRDAADRSGFALCETSFYATLRRTFSLFPPSAT